MELDREERTMNLPLDEFVPADLIDVHAQAVDNQGGQERNPLGFLGEESVGRHLIAKEKMPGGKVLKRRGSECCVQIASAAKLSMLTSE